MSDIGLNPARVGHAYPSFRYEVCREKVREYALATGIGGPAATADSGTVPVPPTFAACFTIARLPTVLADPDLGASANLVHSSQSFSFIRPLRLGDVLRCTPRIADITSRSRMELLTLEVDCVEDGSGAPVVTSRGTLVFLGGPGASVASAV